MVERSQLVNKKTQEKCASVRCIYVVKALLNMIDVSLWISLGPENNAYCFANYSLNSLSSPSTVVLEQPRPGLHLEMSSFRDSDRECRLPLHWSCPGNTFLAL